MSMALLAITNTGTALSATAGRYVCVGFIERMAIEAMSLDFVHCPSLLVNRIMGIQGSEDQMIGVYAPSVLACVVDLSPIRNGAIRKFIGETVCKNHSRLTVDLSTDTTIPKLGRDVAYPSVTAAGQAHNLLAKSVGNVAADACHARQYDALVAP